LSDALDVAFDFPLGLDFSSYQGTSSDVPEMLAQKRPKGGFSRGATDYNVFSIRESVLS
jgi:hypothetical protein